MELSSIELKAHFETLQQLHTGYFDAVCVKFEPILSHGSERLIIRLYSDSGSTSIGIVNSNLDENKAFISFGRHFRNEGLNVPEIFTVSEDLKSYIQEDLGDETLFKRISDGQDFSDEKINLYKAVVEELPKFQVTAGKGIDYSFCYQFKHFDIENIDFDLNYFKQRFLQTFYKGSIESGKLEDDLSYIKGKLLELPSGFFLYRDFQSRNIMLKNDKLYFIDFQSGRKGALLYDMASLLYDAKADLPQHIREELLEHYLYIINGYVKSDKEVMREHFWYFALIRILQAMGAYGFLGIVKGKRRFLESIPYALKNINFILDNKIPKGELLYIKEVFNELLKESITVNEKA